MDFHRLLRPFWFLRLGLTLGYWEYKSPQYPLFCFFTTSNKKKKIKLTDQCLSSSWWVRPLQAVQPFRKPSGHKLTRGTLNLPHLFPSSLILCLGWAWGAQPFYLGKGWANRSYGKILIVWQEELCPGSVTWTCPHAELPPRPDVPQDVWSKCNTYMWTRALLY